LGYSSPLFSAGNLSLVPWRAASCSGHPRQPTAVEGGLFPMLTLIALLQSLSLLKSIRVKKTRLLWGSELRHSCWSPKTTECFATEFLGKKSRVSLTESIDGGPIALWVLSLELPRAASSQHPLVPALCSDPLAAGGVGGSARLL